MRWNNVLNMIYDIVWWSRHVDKKYISDLWFIKALYIEMLSQAMTTGLSSAKGMRLESRVRLLQWWRTDLRRWRSNLDFLVGGWRYSGNLINPYINLYYDLDDRVSVITIELRKNLELQRGGSKRTSYLWLNGYCRILPNTPLKVERIINLDHRLRLLREYWEWRREGCGREFPP